MPNFPEHILECIETLRNDLNRGHYVIVPSFPILEIIKIEKEREISIKLFFDFKKKCFEIQAPSYRYYSKISHYDYNRTEMRWLRNKNYIFDLIKFLKNSGLWNFVLNKDFIVVNSYNKKTNHKQLLKALIEVEKL